ncbi:MAG: metallophosphoesterase family protein [Planctomycetes bacterium]|nr:metallophosphoesterase family protein [Planctomycetota bacterium]
MRYGLIADIHSNSEALTVALDTLKKEGAQEVLCLGDVIGYNATPREVITLLSENKVQCINGNHDRFLAGSTPIDPSVRKETSHVIEWTRGVLGPEHSQFIGSLPRQRIVDDSILMVHGSPRHEDEYILTLQGIRENIIFIENNYVGVQVCLFGHTHTPLCVARGLLLSEFPATREVPLEANKVHLINPGSVGQPRDGCNKSSFALLDTEAHKVTYFREEYDFKLTQKHIREAGIDERMAKRLEAGR